MPEVQRDMRMRQRFVSRFDVQMRPFLILFLRIIGYIRIAMQAEKFAFIPINNLVDTEISPIQIPVFIIFSRAFPQFKLHCLKVANKSRKSPISVLSSWTCSVIGGNDVFS